MAITSSRVIVGTVPVRLDATLEADYSAGSAAFGETYGQRVTIINKGSGSVFIGGPDVTAAGSAEIVASAGYAEKLNPGDALWAVSASGTNRVDVIQVGV